MKLNIKLLSDKAKSPVYKNGVLYFHRADIKTGIGNDGRIILLISSDVEVEVPSNMYAMYVPAEDTFVKSIMFAGGQGILHAGFKGNVSASFKIDTQSMAVLPEDGEIAFGLIFNTINEITMNTVIGEPDSKLENKEAINAAEEVSESNVINTVGEPVYEPQDELQDELNAELAVIDGVDNVELADVESSVVSVEEDANGDDIVINENYSTTDQAA